MEKMQKATGNASYHTNGDLKLSNFIKICILYHFEKETARK